MSARGRKSQWSGSGGDAEDDTVETTDADQTALNDDVAQPEPEPEPEPEEKPKPITKKQAEKLIPEGHKAIVYTGNAMGRAPVLNIEVPGTFRYRRFTKGVPVVLPEDVASKILKLHGKAVSGMVVEMDRDEALQKLRAMAGEEEG
jgi:hypothetical protein